MHVFCKTTVALLLLGVKDERGVLRFADDTGDDPGMRFDVQPLAPIDEQIVELASDALGTPVSLSLRIEQEFSDPIVLSDGVEATVYLATVEAPHVRPRGEWPSLPDILRGMAKDRRRLPYLRAWQILTGGLTLNTKAVDVAELKRYFDD